MSGVGGQTRLALPPAHTPTGDPMESVEECPLLQNCTQFHHRGKKETQRTQRQFAALCVGFYLNSLVEAEFSDTIETILFKQKTLCPL